MATLVRGVLHTHKVATAVHGTFPRRFDDERGSARAAWSWSGAAFAALPLIIALLAAVVTYGRGVTLLDIVEVLHRAATAAPL
jgi:hypothetical protein